MRFTQNSFNESVEEGGKFGGESGKENWGMFRYGTCTVKSSRALRSSLAHTGTHNTQLSAALPGFYQYREHEKKSTDHKFLSTKLEQPAIFDSALDRQQVQLTALPPTHRLSPDKSQHTAFGLRGCSYTILVLFFFFFFFLKLCKGHESQTIQSAQDFFLVQFTYISSVLALQDPNIPFIH